MADCQMRSVIHTSTMFNTLPSVLSNNLPDDSVTSQTTNTNRKIKIKKIKLPSQRLGLNKDTTEGEAPEKESKLVQVPQF